MKHRLPIVLALAVAVCAAVAASALGAARGRAYEFRGELLAASSSSVQLRVEGGTHNALKALLGQSQDQTFAVGSTTEILSWSAGTPRVGTIADLKLGDTVTVRVRDKGRASLSDLEAKPAAIVADHAGNGQKPAGPLYLYVGTVAGPQSATQVALHVTAGNRRALRTLIGQPADQTFATGSETIYLLWQGRVPTVIDPSQLKAGDRITVRVRAAAASTLAQVEATPAVHVGDHEPGNPLNQT